MNELPPIRDRQLLNQALTHRSYANEHPDEGKHNERLEFLGDAVLGFVVGELLYQRYPDLSEAHLTRLRALLVDETQLARLARQLGLGEMMRLGKGAQRDRGRDNPALLSDTFEAIVGAYFLEAEIEAVRGYARSLFSSLADEIVESLSENDAQHLVDSKHRFQQWSLEYFGENPKYFIIDESGPDHAKEFTAEVRVREMAYGVGTGRRKQEAEKNAAEAALKNVGLD
jgi:ribonuclease-3